MELIIRNTERVVEIEVDGANVPARIWQGKTSTGVPVVCFVTRVAVAEDRPEHEHEVFKTELAETEPLREDVKTIPTRLVL